jgi:Ni2+-binding GTPase involved in maturation of urease and hydrogenase
MKADALSMRLERPFFFTNLRSREGVDQIVNFIIDNRGLTKLPHKQSLRFTAS